MKLYQIQEAKYHGQSYVGWVHEEQNKQVQDEEPEQSEEIGAIKIIPCDQVEKTITEFTREWGEPKHHSYRNTRGGHGMRGLLDIYGWIDKIKHKRDKQNTTTWFEILISVNMDGCDITVTIV